MLLAVNSFSHFLVDALCVSILFSYDGDIALAAISYNTLAFSTQCITGLICDKLKRYGHTAVLGMLLVVLGFAFPINHLLKVCIAGLGNSLFHVGGGAITLESSGSKAWKLGVFVAPGAIGVTLGTFFPDYGIILAVLIVIAAFMLIYSYARTPAPLMYMHSEESVPWIPAILLVAAVSVRAIGGSAVSFGWNTGAATAFIMTLFVFAGKAFGGLLCDNLGVKATALLSIPAAALCIAFGAGSMAFSLAGQFLLNLTMPITLWLLYKAMPNSPCFAFGLAASALWPGTIAGQLIGLSKSALWPLILICFIFGLFAILHSDKIIGRSNR